MVGSLVLLHFMNSHGVYGEDKHGNVADDDHNCGDDEAEDEVIIHSQPAIVTCSVTAKLQRIKTHVTRVIVLVDLDQVHR